MLYHWRMPKKYDLAEHILERIICGYNILPKTGWKLCLHTKD